jgi:uncharacterized membrane protein YgcG
VVALSPVAEPFESAWLKWALAVTNAKVLTDNVEVLASDQELKMHSRLATYYDAGRHCLILVVTESTEVPLRRAEPRCYAWAARSAWALASFAAFSSRRTST